MTREELAILDNDLKEGVLLSDEYMQILRDEVGRIHPEIELYEIENMIKTQLRVNALEDDLSDGIREHKSNPEPRFVPLHDGNPNSNCGEEIASSDDESKNGISAQGSVNAEKSQGDKKSAESNQESGKDSSNSKSSGDDSKTEEKPNSSGDPSDKQDDKNGEKQNDSKSQDHSDKKDDSSSDEKSNDSKDEKTDESNDDNKNGKGSGGGGREMWMTYQVVPGWVTFGDAYEQ